jgi:ribonucleoside-triphosphate reductase (thioredoxin)
VDVLGLSSLQNCAFTVVDHPIRPFTWAMDLLMLGSGVGYNIQKKNVDKLPAVNAGFTTPTRTDTNDADFIVPDSREGWVKLLGKTLKAAFLSDNAATFTYSTKMIRGKGAPIKGFGGTASGPEDLCQGIERIGAVLERRRGKKIRPVDALDIMNIIGAVVVAGNVRRSAQIALGDADDVEYLLAKRWDLGNIPSWRAMSNNSVVCDDINDIHEFFWDGYEGKGEPYGLINLKLSRKIGRLGETRYPDPDVQGYNPCAEQSLANFETCCLAEVFLPNVTSKEEFIDICKMLYRINKHSLMLPCHLKETEAIVHKNMRMGIGLTGVLQSSEEQIGWLDECYKELRAFDEEYSEKIGVSPSVKLTTIKPSGTLSLLPGVTPGIHPGYAQYMIRRIRISSNHPLVDTCRKHGYPIEYQRNFDGSDDHSTVVVSFPFSYPEGTKLAKDMTAHGSA